MSICDKMVVMKLGVVQQYGEPQAIYDNPDNLFVANFLGTPPINVFRGKVENGKVYIGDAAIMDAANVDNQEVYVGIRPEGFVLDENGPLVTKLSNVEVMGRDVSVVSSHPASEKPLVRSIISAESKIDTSLSEIRFSVKPYKAFIFNKETEERIYIEEVK
jgi:multiple sugar transport system ATP-binding protein